MRDSLFFLTLISLLFLACTQEEPPGQSIDKPYSEAVEKWAFILSPSVLNEKERLEELAWFEAASSDLSGLTVRSTAENIETHYWESRFLANVFEEITGIKVEHHIQGEGDLVLQILDQIESNTLHNDIYVNDSDLVGTYLRMDAVVDLSTYMKGDGAPFTNPFLDLDDFLNLEMGQDYDGNQLQLPDQQFANLYWFRYDWFSREDLKKLFREQYGYELGVPVNWAAYEDIAEFFSNTRIDGKKVYGHLDYGAPSHSLGWRFTDAWFSMAGVGDKGLPNGDPVDEWGIRVEDRIPRGSSVSRGGAVNSPAAVYALSTYIEWIREYAPPESLYWEWVDAGPQASRGDIAQRIFQYTTWLSDSRFHSPDSPVCDKEGRPKWRLAPSPHGRYWEEGMKVGYQDCGSWTIPQNVTGEQRAAAWLWAQFCVSKTVSLKKFLVGSTPVRRSTVYSDYLSQRIDYYGGLIEFFRWEEQSKWTDSGRNVPFYPLMSALWWENISQAIQGEVSAQDALDNLAEQQDELMDSLDLKYYNPELNDISDPEVWLSRPGSPKEKRSEQAPVTIPYEDLMEQWKE